MLECCLVYIGMVKKNVVTWTYGQFFSHNKEFDLWLVSAFFLHDLHLDFEINFRHMAGTWTGRIVFFYILQTSWVTAEMNHLNEGMTDNRGIGTI